MTIKYLALGVFLYCTTIVMNYYRNNTISNFNQNYKFIYPVFCLPTSWYCGFKQVAADSYLFMMMQQEYSHYPELLFAWAQNITNLDPHFNTVFRFAGVALTLYGKRPDLAIQLLEKSLQSPINHDDWRIYFYLAYNYHFFNHDNQHAAFYLVKAFEIPERSHSFLKADRTMPPLYLKAWLRTLSENANKTQKVLLKQNIAKCATC